MKIHRIIQSCFSVELNGKIIYFDPFKIDENAEKADIILITHPHFDHYSKTSMNRIIKDDSIIICPKRCRKIIKKWNARGLSPGEHTEIDDINIRTVPAYTRLFHNKMLFNWIGYIIDDGTKKIYHAGDTYYVPEMERFPEIDYAFLPIGGIYTMGVKGAMKTAKVIKAKHVIPIHERKKDINEFKEKFEKRYPQVKVHALQKRSSYTI